VIRHTHTDAHWQAHIFNYRYVHLYIINKYQTVGWGMYWVI